MPHTMSGVIARTIRPGAAARALWAPRASRASSGAHAVVIRPRQTSSSFARASASAISIGNFSAHARADKARAMPARGVRALMSPVSTTSTTRARGRVVRRSAATTSGTSAAPATSGESATTTARKDVPTFQDAILRLQEYWSSRGCAIVLPHNTEVGAGTMNPATFLRALGPEPWNVCYPEPSVRPDDSRYGENPNRVQKHTQFQVILKPAPENVQELYLGSLEALGIDTGAHDVRFVEDNWESPVLGAWGLGWEVWMDGMEVTQFTYFQQCGSLKVAPTAVEITYGLERILMALQGVDHFKDIAYNDMMTYGEMRMQEEYEMSVFNLDQASVETHRSRFELADKEALRMLEARLPLPAFDNLLKASHAFNVLDARGAVGVTERQKLFASMRKLARETAQLWVARREELGYPLGLSEAPPAKSLVENTGAIPTAPADCVIELGTEELPPQDVTSTSRQFHEAVDALLKAEGLTHAGISVGATPRRFTLSIKALSAGQANVEERVRGPPLSRAFEEDGTTPSKAAQGFCKKNGVDAGALEKDGEYVWAVVKKEGRSAVAVLEEALPKIIAAINFPRAMRWTTNSEAAFSRPLRWLFGVHGDHHLTFEALGVHSGTTTRLLRTRGDVTDTYSAANAAEYHALLAKDSIVLSFEDRMSSIWSEAKAAAKTVGGEIPDSAGEGLLEEVANLVEAPNLVMGDFEEAFLTLPKEVLVMVMRKHQRYFPVEGADGALKPHFITFANGSCDKGVVKHGNEAVLRARYEDAKFFYETDLKKPLAEFKPELSGITFQQELGNMLEKTQRVEGLVADVAAALGYGPDVVAPATVAAGLARADLATAMVMELTALAGTMGRHYAQKEGLPANVSEAIFEACLPRSAGDALPSTPAGITVAVADRLDTLIGLFAVVGGPKASADPFGLRRAAYGLVQTIVNSGATCDLRSLIELAAAKQPVEVSNERIEECVTFITRRLEQLFIDAGNDVECVRAVLKERGGSPALASASISELVAVDGKALETCVRVLSRPTRLVRGKMDANADLRINEASFECEEERALHAAYVAAQAKIVDGCSVTDMISAVCEMDNAATAFFDNVFVMADDAELKRNRMALCAAVASLPSGVLDFAELPGGL